MNNSDSVSNTYTLINKAKEELAKLMKDSTEANATAMRSVISMLNEQEKEFSQHSEQMKKNHKENLDEFKSL
jgi:hypothetical protein